MYTVLSEVAWRQLYSYLASFSCGHGNQLAHRVSEILYMSMLNIFLPVERDTSNVIVPY